jgi:hypothetical protein
MPICRHYPIGVRPPRIESLRLKEVLRCAAQQVDLQALFVSAPSSTSGSQGTAEVLRGAFLDNKNPRCPGIFSLSEPSDGLEPSTPSLPCDFGGNRWQLVAKRFGLLRRFRGSKRSNRLRPIAPSFFHNLSILAGTARSAVCRTDNVCARKLAPLYTRRGHHPTPSPAECGQQRGWLRLTATMNLCLLMVPLVGGSRLLGTRARELVTSAARTSARRWRPRRRGWARSLGRTMGRSR